MKKKQKTKCNLKYQVLLIEKNNNNKKYSLVICILHALHSIISLLRFRVFVSESPAFDVLFYYFFFFIFYSQKYKFKARVEQRLPHPSLTSGAIVRVFVSILVTLYVIFSIVFYSFKLHLFTA